MSKKAYFIFLFVLVLSTLFVSAANETAPEKKAALCLENKIKEKSCASLSSEEKIFSLLAIGRCKNELIADSINSECWPKDNCKVKTTAQAILALKKSNYAISSAEKWLISKAVNFSSDITWYLQVETSNSSKCRASYLNNEYSFKVNEDKTLSGNAGKCLTVTEDYWFRVNPTCFNQEISISCNDSFSTSLFFKKKSSQMIYVLDEVKSASGEGTTTEIVGSSCFKDGSSCSYEGTLWAALVLKELGRDVNAYIPYLLSLADENEKYLPEAFLYLLTNKYQNELLSKQKESSWWLESGDKFYDTALALLPFQNEDSLPEKSNAKIWLSDVQDKEGCWQGNIRNTAFILYSLWSKKANLTDLSKNDPDCETSGNYCVSQAECMDINGSVLSGFSGCDLVTGVCCNIQQELSSCYELGGELCRVGEECIDGLKKSSSDSTQERICCVEGTCGQGNDNPDIFTDEDTCSPKGGNCRDECLSGESASYYTCESSSQSCCITAKKGSSLIIILILGILILLVIFGIIFKDKIKAFLFNKKNKGNKGNVTSSQSPKFPPTSSSNVYPGTIPRRVMPVQQSPVTQVRRVSPKGGEFNDILKKLKEIGN